MSHLSYTQNFFIYFVIIVAVLLVSLNFIFAIHAPYKEKKTPFECGYHSFLQNRIQFVVSFFTFGLLFLLFDLEIVLIYPYSVSIDVNLMYGLILMVIFAITVTIGFVFEFGKKALTIDSRQFNLREVSMTFESLLDVIEVNVSLLTMASKRIIMEVNTRSLGELDLEMLRTEILLREASAQLVDHMTEIAGPSKPELYEQLEMTKGIARDIDFILHTKGIYQSVHNPWLSPEIKNEITQALNQYARTSNFDWSGVLSVKLSPAFYPDNTKSVSELLGSPLSSIPQNLGLESNPPSGQGHSSAPGPSSVSGPSSVPGPAPTPTPAQAQAPAPELVSPPTSGAETQSGSTSALGLGTKSSHSSLLEAATGIKTPPKEGGSPKD